MADEEKTLAQLETIATWEAGGVKALGGGRVGGYLVVFGSELQTDASPTRDFFTKATDFGPAKTTPMFYHHGFDPRLGLKAIGGGSPATIDPPDDVGIWVEGQLDLRDRYEASLYDMAQAGKLGWSSGTAPHLVRRERKANGSNWIVSWPLGLDASLTPTPAEPRANAIAIKALKVGVTHVGAVESTLPNPDNGAATKNGEEMPNETNKELEGKVDALKTALDLLSARLPAKDLGAVGGDAVDNGATKAGSPLAGVTVTPTKEPPFKGLGEFLFAVRAAREGKLTNDQANRLRAQQDMAIKATGAGESAGGDGGFLVSPDYTNEIITRAYQVGALLSRVDRKVAATNSNSMTFLGIDETSRASGSRYGGVAAYWVAEGGSITASRPKFRRIEMKLNKITALSYATDELLEDAGMYEQVVMQALPEEISFRVEDAIYNGNGSGQPQGLLTADCLVTQAAEGGQTADTINMANITKMWSRLWSRSMPNAVWFINQDVLPQLFQLNSAATSSATPVFLPPGGLSASPYSSLFGRPIIPIEYAATIGDVGDIMLADLSQYRVLDKGSVKSAASMHVQFTTDEMVYRWTFRIDGKPLWHSALTPFKGSNTQGPFVTLAAR